MGADALAAGDADRRQQEIGKRSRARRAALPRPKRPWIARVGSEVISAPPIAMDAMIEPGAGMAEEARNA